MRKKIIVRGPFLSQSGYGEQARFALRSLRAHQDKFDIHLINVGWGRTGWILEDNEERQWIDELIRRTQIYLQEHNNAPPTFDVSLQITVPNEFEKIAHFNIGYTAGIETTKAAPEWIDKCNVMNRLIVPSAHSKEILETTKYRVKINEKEERELKTHCPIDVVSYPVRLTKPSSLPLELESSFNFLSVAQWGPRKNIESTISGFINEFINEPDVGLIVKTNASKNCLMDKVVVEKKLSSFVDSVVNGRKRQCKIYFIHGNLSEEEMAALYTHPTVKAFITTTHGEGFGLPIFEAVCNGLPVIAPCWSGHTDFLFAPKRDKETGKVKNKAFFTKIDFDIAGVQKDAVWPGMIQEDSQWCFVKNYSVRSTMRDVFKNHGTALSQAKKLKEHTLQTLTLDNQYNKFVKSILDTLPKEEIQSNTFSREEQKLQANNILDDIIGL